MQLKHLLVAALACGIAAATAADVSLPAAPLPGQGGQTVPELSSALPPVAPPADSPVSPTLMVADKEGAPKMPAGLAGEIPPMKPHSDGQAGGPHPPGPPHMHGPRHGHGPHGEHGGMGGPPHPPHFPGGVAMDGEMRPFDEHEPRVDADGNPIAPPPHFRHDGMPPMDGAKLPQGGDGMPMMHPPRDHASSDMQHMRPPFMTDGADGTQPMSPPTGQLTHGGEATKPMRPSGMPPKGQWRHHNMPGSRGMPADGKGPHGHMPSRADTALPPKPNTVAAPTTTVADGATHATQAVAPVQSAATEAPAVKSETSQTSSTNGRVNLLASNSKESTPSALLSALPTQILP